MINESPAFFRLSIPLTLKLKKSLNKSNKGQYAVSCTVVISNLRKFIILGKKNYSYLLFCNPKSEFQNSLVGPETLKCYQISISFFCSGLAGLGYTGRVTIKFVPVPGMFFTSIFPLCKSTMCFTIDNPKPVPPSFLDLDESTT